MLMLVLNAFNTRSPGMPCPVGSAYAREKRKSDQAGPILNIWVIIVGGVTAHVIHSSLSVSGRGKRGAGVPPPTPTPPGSGTS